MGLALPGLCCLPVALAGGGFAVAAVRRARRDGRPVPKRVMVALVLCAVSVVFTVWVSVGSWKLDREKRQLQREVAARLSGKRELAALDAQTACDLAEEQLRRGIYERMEADEVTCRGPLEAETDRALLRRVELRSGIRRIPLNACLARAGRWFLLGVTVGEHCPATPPPVPGASAEVQESTLRRQAAEEVDEEEVAAFVGAVEQVVDAVATTPREKRFCPPLDVPALRTDMNATALTLSTVDVHFARSREPGPEWSFLTSDEVRVALDPRRSARERASAVRRMGHEGGPYLVAYLDEERTWPADTETEEGSWAGWMLVTSLKDGRPVCETRLSFGNPAPRGRKAEKRARRALGKLRDHFEDEASERMAAMSGGQFRLGYRLGR